VHTYLGAPRRRDELERELPAVHARWPGSFVVDLDGAMIGRILLGRAPEHHRPAAPGKVDLGYLFLPRARGFGYAAESCAAALGWSEAVLPGEPVVLATQTADVGSMRLPAKPGSPRRSGFAPGTPISGSARGLRYRPPTDLAFGSAKQPALEPVDFSQGGTPWASPAAGHP
jgi:hypothetical protein